MNINKNHFILFKTESEKIAVDVRFEEETVWLSQDQMAVLFERDRSVITKHIAKFFLEGELEEKSNVQILHIANADKPVKFYNLNVIISVGYNFCKDQVASAMKLLLTKQPQNTKNTNKKP